MFELLKKLRGRRPVDQGEVPGGDGTNNQSVARGRWGERQAERFLVSQGWVVTGRNVHPVARDQRCEIDLIVQSADGGSVVFVEVKTTARRSKYAPRLARVDRRKKGNLLRACANWVMSHRWHGGFRFDVVEVYGTPDSPVPPEIDHIENVPLFPPKWRFW